MPPYVPRMTPAVEPNQTHDLTDREFSPPTRPTPEPAPPRSRAAAPRPLAPVTPAASPSPAPVPTQSPAQSGRRQLPTLPPARSRKETLVSPIPALLAASMSDLHEGEDETTPLPVHVSGDATSRFEAKDLRALMQADDSEYVVEVSGGPIRTSK